MDERLADADTGDAALDGGGHDLEAVGGSGASDVHSQPFRVGGISGPPFLQVVRLAPVGTIEHQRDAGTLSYSVERFEKIHIHLLDVAWRFTTKEFTLTKVFALVHSATPCRHRWSG